MTKAQSAPDTGRVTAVRSVPMLAALKDYGVELDDRVRAILIESGALISEHYVLKYGIGDRHAFERVHTHRIVGQSKLLNEMAKLFARFLINRGIKTKVVVTAESPHSILFGSLVAIHLSKKLKTPVGHAAFRDPLVHQAPTGSAIRAPATPPPRHTSPFLFGEDMFHCNDGQILIVDLIAQTLNTLAHLASCVRSNAEKQDIKITLATLIRMGSLKKDEVPRGVKDLELHTRVVIDDQHFTPDECPRCSAIPKN